MPEENVTPPPPAEPGSVREALEFAAKMADKEIEAIQRIHERTLRSVGFVLTLFAALATVLGWFGYQNLRNLAVGVASRQVRDETTKQVQAQVTRENLNGIVAQQISEYVRTQLHDDVSREIRSGPLHEQILSGARAQTQRLVQAEKEIAHVKAAATPRSFKLSKEQQDELRKLPQVKLAIVREIGDTEERVLADDINNALNNIVLSFGDVAETNLNFSMYHAGVHLHWINAKGEKFANELLKAFQAQHIQCEASRFDHTDLGENDKVTGRSALVDVLITIGPKPTV